MKRLRMAFSILLTGSLGKVLSDQRQNRMKGRHKLEVKAEGIRHLRLSISALPSDGSWASIKEFHALGE
jgi:hypothetical protein